MTGGVGGTAYENRLALIVFLVDHSGSMHGEFIESVRSTGKEIILSLSRRRQDMPVYAGAIVFAKDAKWTLSEKFRPLADFPWDSIVPVDSLPDDLPPNQRLDGVTRIGKAFELLNETLTEASLRNSLPGTAEKILIVLYSDGRPTDRYEAGLAALKENVLFSSAAKLAIGVGESVDRLMLGEFTESVDNVLPIKEYGGIMGKIENELFDRRELYGV